VCPFPLNGAIYKPGKLRTGKGLRSPLAPPSQEGVEPNHFRVAEATHFPFFETYEKFARAVKEFLDEK